MSIKNDFGCKITDFTDEMGGIFAPNGGEKRVSQRFYTPSDAFLNSDGDWPTLCLKLLLKYLGSVKPQP